MLSGGRSRGRIYPGYLDTKGLAPGPHTDSLEEVDLYIFSGG